MINKRTAWLCLALVFLAVFQLISADAKDGQYDVKVRLLKAYEDKASMGDPALKRNAKLYVNNGQGRLRIEFKPLDFMNFTGYLGSLKVANQTVKIIENYTIYDEYNHPENGVDSVMKGVPYPKVLEFPIDISKKIINCTVYVPVMAEMDAGTQKARIEVIYPESFKSSSNQTTTQSTTAAEMTTLETTATVVTTVTEVTAAPETTVAEVTAAPETTVAEVTTVPETTVAEMMTVSETTAVEATTETTESAETANEATYYNLPIALWNANEDKPSMGDNAIDHMANLVVNGNQMELYLGAEKMSLMNLTTSLVDLYYDDGEKFLRAAAYDYSIKIDDIHLPRPSVFSLPLEDKVQFLDVMVDPKVEPMGEEPIKARLKLDFANAQQIDKQQASLVKLSQSGVAKPVFDKSVAVLRSDKGITIQAEAGTFTSDFNFYADALRGEALTEMEKKYADQLPNLATVEVYTVSALGDLNEIPYTVDASINDLREAYLPQGDFQLTLPINSNYKGKDFKLYALEDNLIPLDYQQNADDIVFSYNKFVSFAIVADNTGEAAQAVVPLTTVQTAVNSQASTAHSATEQIVINRSQTTERPALIILAFVIILIVLIGGVYFSIKYYKMILAELEYSAELKKEKLQRFAREERRQ